MNENVDPNILIVDDDKYVSEAMADYISKRYYASIDIASNGMEAIERAGNKKYDVLLMDVKMPGIDGIGTLQHIKKNNNSVHTIMITSWHSADVLNDAMEAGANAFLVKPFQPNVLKTRLDFALNSINKLRHK